MDKNRPYTRLAIDSVFAKRKALMHNEAVQRGIAFDGKNLALYTDCYTGKILRGGDPYDYEHIISAEEAFNYLKAFYNDNEIAVMVNHPDNVAVTLRSINKYKGKYSLEERLLKNPKKIKEFEIDVVLAKQNLEKAKNIIYK